MIDLILITGFLHSLLLLGFLLFLFLCFFFCLLDKRGSLDHRHFVVEIEERVLAEIGELCYEPTADSSIAGGLGQATAVF